MSNSSSSSGVGGAMDPRSVDPNFSMRHSSVRTLGTNVSGYGQNLTDLSDSTRSIDIHEFAFGVIGGGLNVAHRSVRDSAADALGQAKNVLDSWKDALNTAATNTEAAEEASKAPKNDGMPEFKGPGGPGGLGDLGGPSGLGGLPKDKGLGPMGGVDPSDLDMKKPPGIDTPDPGDIETPDPGDINAPQPEDINTPDPGAIQQPDLNPPQTPELNTPQVPDPSNIPKPPDTDLAGTNPNLPTTNVPPTRTPDTSTFDPRASMPRTSLGPDGSMGPGGGAGSGAGAPGSIARALNSGVPPMYPPGAMGGAGANNQDNDRERGPHLAEEEGVWGTDEEYAPAVLGMEEE
ncbi:hypothetical protein ACFOY2_51180 [Nonomuraea purpurea]|uniref:WXG100 family type VII secretion target n=1 Tax=Nonomuraea purpurea TaxID=1849276 RepID=A0ABV8GRK6_9ACTN